jgi:hypothetical protein
MAFTSFPSGALVVEVLIVALSELHRRNLAKAVNRAAGGRREATEEFQEKSRQELLTARGENPLRRYPSSEERCVAGLGSGSLMVGAITSSSEKATKSSRLKGSGRNSIWDQGHG